MITSTMNSLEISNLIDKDRERIMVYMNYRFKEMERNLRKGFSRTASKIIDYSTPNAKYKIILYINGKFHTFSLLALNYESNEWLDVTYSCKNMGKQLQYVARSVHFFNRYGERFLLNPNLSLNEIILKFYCKINCSIVLYHDGDHIVYATSNGIVLAIHDEEKQITHAVTYVNSGMLKRSQFSSWLKVWDVCERLGELTMMEVQQNGRLPPDSICDFALTESEKLSVSEASEIYGKFFKHREK